MWESFLSPHLDRDGVRDGGKAGSTPKFNKFIMESLLKKVIVTMLSRIILIYIVLKSSNG